jgi:hypothetical protein
MASYYGHHNPSTYECVDAGPEYIDGESANNNGGLFYFVRPACGSGGHCAPYVADRVITCVVCSK